ncbi:MAG: ABC transporter ATP-binding protein [Alcaligenaceae bacterium]|nr:ABC transporter ATP-binding protein [Alcaligenaceae bacterium SAGV5]MPS53160.1 ABC transporter ATP-binding protein [Alcaligenaceae bacterium SAGV3]MPT55402.1 ABC transporter ATP-binding protein [Alcaligenaceae bacterium]
MNLDTLSGAPPRTDAGLRPTADTQAGTAANPPGILLEARGLRKSFGGVRAVRGISLAIPADGVFALIGPNGAGKSTMMNLLSGAYQPNEGEILFNGRNLVGTPAYARARLGIARTFQSIRLFKQLSVAENVMAGFYVHRDVPWWQYVFPGRRARQNTADCRRETLELLQLVGLDALAARRAGTLAYGQQRMLEIARAMATQPRLLLLDEPAAGLNSTEVQFLLELIGKLRRRGVTVVVVEHNMDLVMTVADHVFVMDHGEYLFQGKPHEVQTDEGVIAAYLGGQRKEAAA